MNNKKDNIVQFEEISSENFLNRIKKGEIVKDKIILGVVEIDNISNSKLITINNCIFKNDISFDAYYRAKIEMISCKCEMSLKFSGGEYGDIKISLFNGESINFIDGTYKGLVDISWLKLRNISVMGGNYYRLSMGSLGIFNKESNNDLILDNLYINPLKRISGKVQIMLQPIKSIILIGDNNLIKATVTFIGTIFESINCYSIAKENIRFDSIEPINENAYVSFNVCDLENVRFNDIDFTGFKLIFFKSILTKITTTNIKWSSEIFTSFENDFLGQRENYRQLKLAMLNQGDKLQALEFEKSELNAHRKSLSWKKGEWKDKFILLSNWTNEQGQNWFRPLCLLIIISLMFYVFIKISLGCTTFNPSFIVYDIGKYFTFINPMHSTDFLETETIKLTDWAYLWDGIYRFFSAYLLFQIVKAFRKYVINR